MSKSPSALNAGRTSGNTFNIPNPAALNPGWRGQPEVQRAVRSEGIEIRMNLDPLLMHCD
jgi:hypothetical protein